MSWERVKLKELLTIKNGKDHKSLKDGIYPVYGSGGIMRYADKYLYDKESILLPRKGTLNNIQFARTPFWTVDTCYYTVVNTDRVVPYFLFRNLRQFDIEALNTGSAVPSMTFDKYYTIEINLPDLPTQQRIASILSAYDDLIEVNRKQIKLLEEAAERLYREWFIDLRFPGHETVTFNADGLPEGWRKDRLDTIANIVMGQSPSSDNYNDAKIGLPFHQGVTTYGNRFVVDNVYSAKYSKVAEQLDVLFSVRAPVGRLNITKNKIAIGRGLSAIRHKANLQSFLFYALKNEFYKEDIIGNGSIFSSITKEQLYSYKLVIPTIELQKKYDEIAREIDKQILSLDSQMVQAAEARDLLLPRLMNGEIQL